MKKLTLAILFVFFVIYSSKAQNKSFNLNDTKSESLKSLSILGNTHTPNFQNAIKSRELVLNPILQDIKAIHVDDTIQLDLFDNMHYNAYIDKIETDVNGTSVVRARLVDYNFGYCLISTYNGKSFMTIEVPEKNELYLSKYDQVINKLFLLQIDKSKQKALEGSPPVAPQTNDGFNFKLKDNDPKNLLDQIPSKNTTITSDNLLKRASLDIDPNASDTITLMIVYTPAAEAWSKTNETDINNTINLLMAKAQLVIDNSKTATTLKLVYSAQVNYTELNSIEDLFNLTNTKDGLMDNVHQLRDKYGADLVVLLENIDFSGGRSWILNSTLGLPSYAFSISRVQQVSWTYTTIHEIAYNLGCSHNKLQNIEPGPGLYSYSSGWRWNGPSGEKYCSIMNYESGSYFSDGINATMVPFFSSPNIQYQGIPIGDAVEADNARTIRETKSVVASYRNQSNICVPPTVQATNLTLASITDNSITIGWTRGKGNSVLVVARKANAVYQLPENGISYLANANFGSGSQIGNGNYVVYNGSDTSVNISSLLSGTTYSFDIYEYSLTSNCYLAPALTSQTKTTGTTTIAYPFEAKWTWQNPLPQGNRLFSIKYISSTEGWSVGEHGTILNTNDGGTTWITQTSGTTNDLMGVSFSDNENGTVVGGWADWNGNSSSLILRTTNGGKTWTKQTSGISNYLYGVAFTDKNTGTVVGAYGTILRTTDGGANWTKQTSGTSYTLYGVSFSDSNNGTAVGDGGTVLRTNNGGATWISQSSGTTNILMCASFSDSNNGQVVGHGGIILRTFDGGTTWTIQSSGTTLPLYGVSLIDKNTGIIVGAGSVILSTSNGGTNWSTQYAKPNDLISVSFSDPNNGIAVGGNKTGAQSSIILKTTDGGKTWIEKSASVTGQFLHDVCFSDVKTGIAVGTSGTVISTNDGGINWINQSSGSPADFGDVEHIDAQNWIAVGGRGARWDLGEKLWTGIITRTSDGGKTWISQSLQPTDKAYSFSCVNFRDPMNGIIVGGEYRSAEYVPGLDYFPLILRTTNGGKDWIRQDCDGVGSLTSVCFSDKNNGFAVGQLPMNGGQYYYGLILRTTDGGSTWTLQQNNIKHGLGKVYFIDSNNGIILTDHYNIVRTTDGGNTWFEQSVGSTDFKSDVFFTDSLNGTIVASPDILKTNDGGKTWVKQPIGTKNVLTSTYFFDANNGIIVGQGGTILKTTGISCTLPPAAGTITGARTVCQGESSEIYSVAAIQNATNYTWSYSGTGVTIMNGSTNSIYIIYSNSATSGILTVKGTNSCGDGPASTLSISVNPVPDSAGKIDGATLVNPSQSSITYSVPAVTNATSYIWTLPAGATGTSTTNSISLNFSSSAVSGVIKVKGHNICLDGAESSLAINVNKIPIAIAGTNQIFNEKTSISLDGSASKDPDGNSLTYKWIAPSGISLSSPSASNPTFTSPDVKNDSIIVFMLIVNDGTIDSNPSSVIITLRNVINTGTVDLSMNGLKAYPNPVTNELIIELEGNNVKIGFEILNALGRAVYKGKLINKITVPTSHFTPGVYFIKFENGKTFELKKIIKE